MQWLGKRQEQDPKEFWRQISEKRGGPISFLSYALLLGRSGGGRFDLSGLLYAVGEAVWFEDFEKDNWFARLIITKGTFTKTEVSFTKAEVTSSRLVMRSSAARCIGGKARAEDLPDITALGRVLSTPIACITLSDGSSLFFDVMRLKEFMKLFESPTP